MTGSYKEEFLAQFQCEPPDGVPQELAERYRFVSALSRKSTREVYLLADKQTGERAVLKIARQEDPESLDGEHRILSRLSHPNIPRAMGLYRQDDRYYLLRSWAEGETLDFLLARDGVFDERRVMEIALALCDILQVLHSHDPVVVFRDLKPQNIVMTPNGRVQLIDFGISREFSDGGGESTLAIGSAQFAAPENFGFSLLGPHTDIFALGRLMAWLATGSSGTRAYRDKIQTRTLRKIIAKCVNLAPEKRYRSVEVLARKLKSALTPPGFREALAGSVAFAAVFALGLLLWGKYTAEPQDAFETGAPRFASGVEYEKEAAFRVTFNVLMNGQPYSDCVVAVDNRNWYYPNEDGLATIWAYAYDMYSLKVSAANRTAVRQVTVNRDYWAVADIDLGLVPQSEEFIPLACPAGEEAGFHLEVSGAEEITLQGQPEGVWGEFTDGRAVLRVSESLPAGHYYFFMEARNQEGFSISAISLTVESDTPYIGIMTADELDAIRNNPGGRYMLEADITLPPGWQPIGTGEEPFTGVFDGGGHTISGLNIRGDYTQAGLFGVISGARVENVVLRDADIYIEHGEYGNAGALIGVMRGGLVQNCGVFGGSVAAGIGAQSNLGGLIGRADGVILGCFSSAAVTVIPADGDGQTHAGGICGLLIGYAADCVNAGAVDSTYIAGGIAGMNDNSVITRAVSGGEVDGMFVNGKFPPGGISHIIRVGRYNSNSAYLDTAAQVGTSTVTNGYPVGLAAVPYQTFRDAQALAAILRVDSSALKYASADSYFPVPGGIFPADTPPPNVAVGGRRIFIEPRAGTLYFYTLDGSDPRLSPQGVQQLELYLEAGQTLRVFAASEGHYDSDTVTVP